MKNKLFLLMTMVGFLIIGRLTLQAGQQPEKMVIEVDGRQFTYTSRLVDIYYQDQLIDTSAMPGLIYQKSTLVPIREIFETAAVGASVEWNNDKQEAYILYQDQLLVIKVDDPVAYLDGQPLEMDVPAKLIRDISRPTAKTMVPLRFICETFGFQVNWDNQAYRATLSRSTDEPIESEISKPSEGKTTPVTPPVTEPLPSLPTALAKQPVKWQTNQTIAPLVAKGIAHDMRVANHKKAKIFSVRYREDKSQSFAHLFMISATSPFSRAEAFYSDKQLVVDVYNAYQRVKKTTIEYQDNPVVSCIKLSEREEDGVKITRVVFDLKDNQYDVKLHLNRLEEKIYVEIIDKSLRQIVVGQDEVSDYIDVVTDQPTEVTLGNQVTGQVRVMIGHSKNLLGDKIGKVEGQFIKGMELSQKDQATVELTVQVRGQPFIERRQLAPSKWRFRLLPSPVKQLTYQLAKDGTPQLSCPPKQLDGFKLLQVENNPYTKQNRLIFTGDLKKEFGFERWLLADSAVEDIQLIYLSGGRTEMRIKTKQIREVLVDNQAEQLTIKLVRPRDIYDQLVVIDIGHGGRDSGAFVERNLDGQGLQRYMEKTLNYQIAMKLKQRLDGDSTIKAYYTRLDDSYLSLEERSLFANDLAADMLISIHNNSVNSWSKSPFQTVEQFYAERYGTEVYYGQRSLSGTLSDKRLAEIALDQLAKVTDFDSRRIAEEPTLYMLKYPVMPAIITEIGFMINKEDLRRLVQDEEQNKIAEGLYRAIVEGFAVLGK